MRQLPEPFIAYTRQLMGDARFDRYLQSLAEPVPVSIRLNPLKTGGTAAAPGAWTVADGEAVGWCRNGYYLRHRPNFTMDPLLHAGCYYVQEAASMFLDEVVRQLMDSPTRSIPEDGKCLDLCAAPGGKSTLLRVALPSEWTVYSNEPVRQRADVLRENVEKWGWTGHIVTNCYARDYSRSGMRFDLIVCDVPCSGEGMFRKDEATIGEWSLQQVEKCRQLQRSIVSDIWPCLNEGGILVYSTCTLNTRENEENIRWLLSEYDAEAVAIRTRPEWHIQGSLLEGFDAPVYRFIPGITRGEGLFLCVVRKREAARAAKQNRLPAICFPTSQGETAVGEAALTYHQAIAYLRGEALTLPEGTPRGLIGVSFEGQRLGMVKNIGNRANNLYPKPWRIKTTHIPDDYEAILRHT